MEKKMVILVMLAALAGCTTISPTETAANDTAGVYRLVAVNGSDVPTTVSHGNAKIKVHSGTFIINADGTCISKTVFGSQKINREVKATYTQEGSTLNMQWIGAGRTEGTIEGETFTMNNEGMTFTYKK